MKKISGFIVLLSCLILGSLGCPSKSSVPSSPSGPNNNQIPTSTPIPQYMIDNFEDGNTQIMLLQGRNGTWFDFATANSAISPSPFVVSSPGYNGTYCAAVSGTTDGTSGHNSVLEASFLSGSTPYSIPASYTGISFMIKGSVSGSSVLWFEAADTTTSTPAAHYDEDGAWVTVSGSWAPVTVFFSQMDTQGFGVPQGTHALDTANALNLSWQVETRNATFNFQVDNVQFVTSANGTLTPTPMASTAPTNLPTLGSTVTCIFPATAGLTQVGSSTLAEGAGNIMTTEIYVPSYVGVVTAYLYLQNAQGQASAAIYSDNGSGTTPNNLIMESSSQSAVNGWNSFPMPAGDLTAGIYWLSCQVQGTTNAVYDGTTGNLTQYAPYTWSAGSFPGGFPGGSIAVQDQMSFYVMYCNANTPTPPPTFTSTPTLTPSSTPTNLNGWTSTPTYTPQYTSTPTATCPAPSGNIGSNSNDGSQVQLGNAIYASRYYFPQNAEVKDIEVVTTGVCPYAAGQSATIYAAIYSDSLGSPGGLVSGVGSIVEFGCYSTVTPDYVNLPLPYPVLSAGYYWLAVSNGGPNWDTLYGTSVSGSNSEIGYPSISQVPPAAWPFDSGTSTFAPEISADWVCP